MTFSALLPPLNAFRQIVGGDPGMRRVLRRLPAAKRCKQCYVPFLGSFSLPFQLIQIRPSRKNPNLCTV